MRTKTLSLLLLILMGIYGCGGGEDAADDAGAGDSAATSDSGDSAQSSSADADSGKMLDHIPADTVLAVSVRPSKALANSLFTELMGLAAQSNPNGKSLDEGLAEFEAEIGIPASDVEQVVACVDGDTLTQVAPMAIMVLPTLMGGGLNDGPPVEFSPEDFPGQAPPELDQQRPDEAREEEEIAFRPQDENFGGPGMGGLPIPAVFVQLANGTDPQKLLDAVENEDDEKIDVGSGQGLKGPNGAVIVPVGDSMIAVGPESRIESLASRAVGGAMTDLVRSLASNDLAIAIDVTAISRMINENLQSDQPNYQLVMLSGVLGQIKTLTLAVDLEKSTLLGITAETINPEAASGMEAQLNGFLAQGKQRYSQPSETEEMPPELKALADEIVNGTKVKTDGASISITVPRPSDADKLPEILKPIIEQQQQAAEAFDATEVLEAN